jgi:hypothetical protein
MAGYSGTPLVSKLGIKPGYCIFTENAPDDYLALLGQMPEEATVVGRLTRGVHMVHLFITEADGLAAKLARYQRKLGDEVVIWVSWPKKAARIATDVTEDVIREAALPLGLVDVKVCAVNETWSGLKLVVRLVNRKSFKG